MRFRRIEFQTKTLPPNARHARSLLAVEPLGVDFDLGDDLDAVGRDLELFPINSTHPAPPPGHPNRTIPWVAGRGSGPERFHVSGNCSRSLSE